MQLARPVSAAEFKARLDALQVGDRFAIAVSGGRDSMALARLCAETAKRPEGRVVALIVDHGLRDAAAAEAAQAKAWCEAAGVEAHILTWRGAKPDTAVQAKARNARYFLLAEAANALALPAVLTAHNVDDQAETLMMRLARGAGPSGLASMDDETEIAAGASAPVRLVRPLLSFARDALTATVREYGQDYIDDPSNEDQQFERVRVRRAMQSLYDDGVVARDALLRTAQRMGAARRARLEDEAHAFAVTGGIFTRWGGAAFDAGRLAVGALHRDGVMARTIHAVSGGEYPPAPEEAAQHLEKALATGAASIGGALLKRAGAQLWVLREPAAILGRAGVAPLAVQDIRAGGILWDRRFVIRAAEGLTVRPLGEAGLCALGEAAALMEGPREAIMSAPGLYAGGRLIGAPGLLSRGDAQWSARPLAAERFSGGIIRFSQD